MILTPSATSVCIFFNPGGYSYYHTLSAAYPREDQTGMGFWRMIRRGRLLRRDWSRSAPSAQSLILPFRGAILTLSKLGSRLRRSEKDSSVAGGGRASSEILKKRVSGSYPLGVFYVVC